MAKTRKASTPETKARRGDTVKASAKPNPAASPAPDDRSPDIDIGISAGDRKKISQALSTYLSDAFTLYLKTHNFHWNVTGSMFNALHNMFEAQYTEQWNAL